MDVVVLKLSTKGRYGLRIMVDLAIHSTGEHVSLSSVAERQKISSNYLEQVISSLRKAGLVKSVKGAQGGYLLANKPSKISVGEVLRALEGDFASVNERYDTQSSENNTLQKSIQFMVWDKLAQKAYECVDSITIEDVANDYRYSKDNEKPMYFI